ncbi:MAG: hypothetical protein V4687_13770 [Bacteroidota bacterium]
MTNNVLSLYRGDSIHNQKTNPGTFRSDGIRSGAFGGGGDPRNIEKLLPLTTIKQHIDHITQVAKDYYKITDFISFTEQEATALNWAADLKPDELLPCTTPYEETRYVFHVAILKTELKPVSKGVWSYQYQCNPRLKLSNYVNGFLKTFALQNAGCDVCGGMVKRHSLLLIKPIDFMEDLNGQPEFKRTLKLAVKNDEWLLLPNDLMDHGFRRTRIYPADFWKANQYIKKGEPRRTPESFTFSK